jgi:hypothetical protein
LGVNIFGKHANNFLSIGAGATVFGRIVGIGDLNKHAKFQPNRAVNIEDIGGFVEKWGKNVQNAPARKKFSFTFTNTLTTPTCTEPEVLRLRKKTVNKTSSESEKFGGGG